MSGVLKTVRHLERKSKTRDLGWNFSKRSDDITCRQRIVLKAIWQTGSLKDAASMLKVSPKTVQASTRDMRYRLGFSSGSIGDLLKWGVHKGWLTLLLLCLPCLAGNPHYATIRLAQTPANMGYLSGAGNYYVGSTITIATQPFNALYQFHWWSDGNTNATRQIRVPKGGQTFTASYVLIPQPPPIVYTNSLLSWSETVEGYVYRLTWVPGTNMLTLGTNFMITNLVDGQKYSAWVQASATNGLWSFNSCTNNWVAGGGPTTCP